MQGKLLLRILGVLILYRRHEMEKIDRRRKYDEKKDLIAKTYKLERTVVSDFAEKCKEEGKSQSGQLTELMNGYIDRNKKEKAN